MRKVLINPNNILDLGDGADKNVSLPGEEEDLPMSDGLSAARIMARCDELARCSEQADGLTRVFLSPEQRAANELVLGWMREAGMSARLDAIGNCVGRYEGDRPGLPCLMLGSHLDTVRDAGKYDGMLGVVAAIECVRSLHERGKRLPFAIEIVGFADEEGTRFGVTLLGSRAVAGTFKPEALDAVDKNAVSLRDALSGHAGTVPMDHRQDALAAAAECVLAIERRCKAVPELVGTVGKLECLPGAINVIPGKVRFTIDIRSPRNEERLAAVSDVQREMQEICERRGVNLHAAKTHEGGVAACASWLMQQIGQAIAAEDLPVRKLPSGAGHDGMAIIDLVDIGMLFVRCKGGISHNPAEAITLDDAGTGARVFMRFIENFR